MKEKINESILMDYIRKRTTDEETSAVESWMKESPENRSTLKAIAKIVFALDSRTRIETRSSETAYSSIEYVLTKNDRRRRVLPRLLVAASFAGALILSSLFALYYKGKVDKGIEIATAVNPGVRSTVTLPDGSVVELNTGSKLYYPPSFDGERREVRLSGEALFKVTENRDKPFIVSTLDRRGKVTVLGTVFNVQSFEKEERFSTTLVEGSVEVRLTKKDGSIHTELLKPLNKLTFYKDIDSFAVNKTDAVDEIAWTRGLIVFRRTKMYDVIKSLAYNFNTEFRVEDPSIYEYELTGAFDNKQLPQILEYLKMTSHIKYEIINPTSDDRSETKRIRVILKR